MPCRRIIKRNNCRADLILNFQVTNQWTIRKVLAWTASYFREKGIKSYRLDAEILLAFALKTTRLQLYIDPDRPLDSEVRASFKKLISRRIHREPVAYITGEKEFWSLPIKVDSRVLIPRPETEFLVDIVIKSYPQEEYLLIADLGTGSGCITLALASELSNAIFYCSDISAEALSLATENFRTAGIESRITARCGSWFNAFEKDLLEGSLDVIVSNPPYIASEIYRTDLAPEIFKFEPRIALDGGESGTDPYVEIAKGAAEFLKDNGLWVVEIGADQANQVVEIFQRSGFGSVNVIQDAAGLDRIVSGRRLCRS